MGLHMLCVDVSTVSEVTGHVVNDELAFGFVVEAEGENRVESLVANHAN
jgi:hypothetical protein